MEIIRITKNEPVHIYASRMFTALRPDAELNLLVVIRDGVIESVQPADEEELASLKFSRANLHHLGPDCTLMPALIDAHIHLALCCRNESFPEADLTAKEGMQSRITVVFDQLLQAGIGLVRDGGDREAFNLQARQLAAASPQIGLRVVATGEALRRHGGYGSFLGRGYRSSAELNNFSAQAVYCGVDQLKVVLSGVISFSEYGVVKGPLLPASDLALIVETARSNNLKIMAHASSAEAVDLAVTAGVDSVEHGYFVRKETLQKMADLQIAWVPTIIPVAVQLSKPQVNNYTPAEHAVIRRAYREQLDKLSLAFEYGVPVGIGTDAGAVGVRHGDSLISEMERYSEGKIQHSAIIRAATAVNAKVLGVEKEAGTIEPGKKPYLLAVWGDPLADLAALRQINKHFVPVF